MSDRGLPSADGAHACPFVAFEDDRDERAAVPDHRHRCYAEVRPAPRALAHQEAYCLSSAFPVCPTFQDWARREAAQARGGIPDAARPTSEEADEPIPPPIVGAGLAAAADSTEPDPADEGAPIASGTSAYARPVEDLDDAPEAPAAREAEDGEPRRNPPREWSAPPPWLASAEAANRSTAGDEPPGFLARRGDPARGLAGSPADILAGGSPPREPQPKYRAPAEPMTPRLDDREPMWEVGDEPRPVARRSRPRAYDQHLGGPSSGPDWERPRRYEAYPTIRTRIGMPQIPRLALMAGAIAIAAIALFFLPALLGLGDNGGGQVATSPSPSASPSRSVEPTPTPAPTPIVYTVQTGDTLSKIAVQHGVTVDQILAANPEITNPNRITLGQRIVIPGPSPSVPEVIGGSGSPAASEAPP